MKFILSVALVLALSQASLAAHPRYRAKRCSNVACAAKTTATVVHEVASGVVSGVQTSIAQSKANTQASQGHMRHIGGSFGAGRYEGVGFSSVSAEDAIRRCCYWGRRTPVDIGVSRGANGWYATVLYQ
jgi:hypothetical protein